MKPVHVSILLDRSQSMLLVADETVAGFNRFLEEQRATEGDARVTLIQFDSEDPFEVVIDGVPIGEVADLDRETFVPRELTPLYDSVGRLIARIDQEIYERAAARLPDEDQVALIVTDGQENASNEFTKEALHDLTTARRERGWVFVYLGADQDVWYEAGVMGVGEHDRIAWRRTKEGAAKMWKDVSHSTAEYRRKGDELRRRDRDRFYEEGPEK